MEFEYVVRDLVVFKEVDYFLKRDGKILMLELRCVWDLYDFWVKNYIDEWVICMLKEFGMGFFKLDYFELLGIGVDYFDSLGEGLCWYGEGIYVMFDYICEKFLEMVIEFVLVGGNCLEVLFVQRVVMVLFSDVYEMIEILIVFVFF